MKILCNNKLCIYCNDENEKMLNWYCTREIIDLDTMLDYEEPGRIECLSFHLKGE